MTEPIDLILETGQKRVFASAADWPGWSRGGRTRDEALAALAAAAERYAPIAAAAGHPLPTRAAANLRVAEEVAGDASTDFGVPRAIAALDTRPTTAADAARLNALVGAAWDALDRIAAFAPEELAKGPRGGGRDTSNVVAHVTDAEAAYAGQIGIGARDVAEQGSGRPAAVRRAIAERLAAPSDGTPLKKWPARYAARRVAWHVLDHAWEIEDRTPLR
jgi:hypothetical protein